MTRPGLAQHLCEKTDRACLNAVDRNGRTALFYAAAANSDMLHGDYGWLLTMGADREHTDNFNKKVEGHEHIKNKGPIARIDTFIYFGSKLLLIRILFLLLFLFRFFFALFIYQVASNLLDQT